MSFQHSEEGHGGAGLFNNHWPCPDAWVKSFCNYQCEWLPVRCSPVVGPCPWTPVTLSLCHWFWVVSPTCCCVHGTWWIQPHHLFQVPWSLPHCQSQLMRSYCQTPTTTTKSTLDANVCLRQNFFPMVSMNRTVCCMLVVELCPECQGCMSCSTIWLTMY